MLRRNIHRLEKGLIMRPRRDRFALDYIQETVDNYCQLVSCGLYCQEEIQWASDVLSEYFNAVQDSSLLTIKKKFLDIKPSSNNSQSYTPYPSKDSHTCNVSTAELHHLFSKRRSRRWFLEEPIGLEKLDTAISLASLAPSACNRQPYYFKVFRQKNKIERIAKLAMGTSGFHHNIPCLLALVGDLSSYPEERDRHVIYIDGSLAAMQLMLALETMNLGSCPINWPDIEKREKKMTKEIALKPYERVIMLIAVGVPDPEGGIPFSQKKGVSFLKEVVE